MIKAAVLLFVAIAAVAAPAQRARQGVAACRFAGAYRINVGDSDRLYTAVQDATSSVPFREQQRFFMDLSIRLTPPDLLALECEGSRVSVGSSRAEKVTFLADGRQRRESSPRGGAVFSRISMTPDTLVFTSSGKAEDNLNVTFRSVDNGRRLQVTRRIYAEQLSQPVVINSFYDKLSDRVDWNAYGQGQVAASQPGDARESGAKDVERSVTAIKRLGPDRRTNSDAGDLRRSLNDWIAATNRRDIDQQMGFYMPTLQAFYLSRNTPRSAVRAEKQRAFSTASAIDIHAAEPEIFFQDSGRTAVMRFRKQYRILDRNRPRGGEVVQELRWQRTPAGWRITSERDVKVIRKNP